MLTHLYVYLCIITESFVSLCPDNVERELQILSNNHSMINSRIRRHAKHVDDTTVDYRASKLHETGLLHYIRSCCNSIALTHSRALLIQRRL